MRQLTRLHGATLQPDGATSFSLWAPDARSVALRLGDGSVHRLHHQDDGWYSARISCGAGTHYRFLINDRLSVPDPASRYQPKGVDGPSCVVDPNAYPWRQHDWRGRPWHETVIHELHPAAYGGFAGISQRLPELRELGVTAIELMPISEYPGQYNWGYDGVFPFAPKSSLGTPDELKQLIDAAHGLGLMVFLDVVYNHFGPHGNYLAEYASAFFDADQHTPWGAAIDFSRPEVADFFCENALMWLSDYRLDGLRLDAVHAITDQQFLRDLIQRVRGALPSDRYVHLMLENEHNQASLLEAGYDAQWNDDGHHALHVLLTGEWESYYSDFAQDTTIKLARCMQEGFIYQGETSRSGSSRGEPSGHLPPTAFILFLQNHDQIGNRALGERLINLADHRAIKAALGLVLLCPMIPLLFMGEEWGCEQPFLYFTDHPDELAKAVREGRRNEFADFKAFADEQLRQRIPDPNTAATYHSSVPNRDAGNPTLQADWFAYYRTLLQTRHTHIIPRLPGTESDGTHILGEKAISACWRMGDGSRLRIDLNLSEHPVAVASPDAASTLIHDYRASLSQDAGLLPGFSSRAVLDPAT
ncbi:MAG: malto-oligosyltrehalose trehalohydrolase [Pseudomonas sp.]